MVVSATQIGKTTACAAWLLSVAWENPGTLNWWCAPTYKQSRVGFRAMKWLAMSAGALMPGPRGSSEAELTLRFLNGAIIECRSWERDENLQGPSVFAVVIDEAGLLTSSARAIISSRRSATLGPARYIGNPVATGSEFWLLCQQAIEGKEAGDGYWDFLRWTWRDRAAALEPGARAEYAAFIERERRTLVPFEFQRLYEAEWAAPENAIFAPLLEKMAVLPIDDEPHAKHPYLVAWDIGLQRDYTVGVPLCLTCFTVTHMVRLRPGDSGALKAVIRDTCIHWNNATAVIETNGPGKPVFDAIAAAYKNVQGWYTDNSNKRTAVFEVLRRGMDGTLTIAPIPALLNELRVFESQQNPKTQVWSFGAPSGAHDDCAMALIIAVGAATSGGAAYIDMLRRQLADKAEKEKRVKS